MKASKELRYIYNFHELQVVKKYLRKLNNIQRAKYEKKFKTFTFKTTFSIKKSIITIILKIRIITTFIKLITSIIFI